MKKWLNCYCFLQNSFQLAFFTWTWVSNDTLEIFNFLCWFYSQTTVWIWSKVLLQSGRWGHWHKDCHGYSCAAPLWLCHTSPLCTCYSGKYKLSPSDVFDNFIFQFYVSQLIKFCGSSKRFNLFNYYVKFTCNAN